MSYEHYIGVLDEESVMAECGPMRLVIRAFQADEPRLGLAGQAAHASITFLERIARWRPLLSRPWGQIVDLPEDELAHRMFVSVKAIGDDDLTPMAAVAGTIADAVADWLFERETTKVIVDNGGDIAIRLSPGEQATVGIRPQITSPFISHMINLNTGHSWGVATSGMGGRSFTRGIASAVTVLAETASVADAAATSVANACFVDDPCIVQLPAEKIDPHSDLSGINVTAELGPLSSETIDLAVSKAGRQAEIFSRKGFIMGAFIALANTVMISGGMRLYTAPVQKDIRRNDTGWGYISRPCQSSVMPGGETT